MIKQAHKLEVNHISKILVNVKENIQIQCKVEVKCSFINIQVQKEKLYSFINIKCKGKDVQFHQIKVNQSKEQCIEINENKRPIDAII
jgi:hypothetical protein